MPSINFWWMSFATRSFALADKPHAKPVVKSVGLAPRVRTELRMKDLMKMRLGWACLVGVLAGCQSWPEPIYPNQVAPFRAMKGEDPTMEGNANACAGRLNAHRSAAKSASATRTVFTALGGLTGGTGGIVAAALSEQDAKTVSGVVGGVGAGIGLVGAFVVELLADPTDRLTRHGSGRSSWDVASRAAQDWSEAAEWKPITLELNMREAAWSLELTAWGGACELEGKQPMSGTWTDFAEDKPDGVKRECSEVSVTLVDSADGKKTLKGTNPDASVREKNLGSCYVTLSCDTQRAARTKARKLAMDAIQACLNDRPTTVVPGDTKLNAIVEP